MRYALYFTPPPSHPLTAAASRWLGRDAFSGGMQPLPHVSGVTALQGERLVGEPRRYGFHGTLVAPFRLSPAATPDQLGRLAETFCADLRPFELPKLEIVRIGRFFALCPSVETAGSILLPLRRSIISTRCGRRWTKPKSQDASRTP